MNECLKIIFQDSNNLSIFIYSCYIAIGVESKIAISMFIFIFFLLLR